MTDNCLDIGIIQSFLDCELDHARSAEVSSHVAGCDACAALLAQAEDESAIVFPALEREFNTLVPTQRLWNKINESITEQHESRPIWEKMWAVVAAAFASPSLVAAAGLIIVIGVFALIWSNRNTAPELLSRSDVPSRVIESAPLPSGPLSVSTDPSIPVHAPAAETKVRSSVKPETAAYRVERHPTTPTAARANVKASTTVTSDNSMPGEESYIKTIANLSKTVDAQKDTVMRPSQRVAYERDMAMVNDSIAKMKGEVKKNPGNESAKQVLYASYQNKIDLLNSVSQKEELMASLQR
jgi:hypothetical protein